MTRQRAVLWFCMLALLAAQVLGFMHRVVHAPQPDGTAAHAHGWVHDLFAVHEDDSTCRLLDSVSLDAAGFAPSFTPHALVPSAAIALAESEARARRAELFEARGPPPPSFA